MSEVHNTASVATEPTVEPATAVAPADPLPTIPAVTEPAATSVAPVVEEPKTDAIAPVEEPKTESAAAAVEEKAVEPISEGQLAYKGPGLVKSLIPSKKEFWLDDSAVTPQNLDLYLRGEKPEISLAVVAWASQTGRGLLFFNKKGDTDRTHPADVLALYDATDLKKESPHSFAFRLNGHNHTFKATSDAERDGWYFSIEKAIELGKASKEEVRASEGYKTEVEKLSKPNVAGVAGVAGAAKRSQSQPKKSADLDNAAVARVGSDAEEDSTQKKQKSRSTSRGMLNRFKVKKDETEQKAVEKKEEKAEAKEEQKAAETEPVAEPVAVAETAPVVIAADSPLADATEDKSAEPALASTEAKTEEKPKPAKRGSIFGKVQSGWSNFKSPTKEKSEKEAELKSEVPAKDALVSENPPQIPETTTATEPVTEITVPAVEEPVAEPAKDTTANAVSPATEKKNFLSGLGGFIKRDRSVSPSANLKEPAKKEEAAIAPAPVEATPEAAVKPEEPVSETPAVTEPAAVEAPAETSAEKPTEEIEESKGDNVAAKRQSVFGTLGRRASKAFRGLQSPRKENATPAATEAKKEETAEVKPTEETPVVNGESKALEAEAQPSIGDVVPEAVNIGQPQHTTPVVTASA